MNATANPYTKGNATWFAWESGYKAALDDVKRIMREDSYGGDYKAENVGMVLETSGRDETGNQ